MANKVYKKDDMNFEGISMQEGKSSSTLKLLAFMIVTAVILGLLIFTAGSFFARNDEASETPQITILPTSSQEEPTVAIEPTVDVDITPSVTPKVTVNKTVTPTQVTNKKATLVVEILNGSGIKGAAGKMSTVLVSAGYTVSRTGNADAFTYTGVTINLKKSKAVLLDQLKKDLSAGSYLVTGSTTTLAETSDVDAVIILGSE